MAHVASWPDEHCASSSNRSPFSSKLHDYFDAAFFTSKGSEEKGIKSVGSAHFYAKSDREKLWSKKECISWGDFRVHLEWRWGMEWLIGSDKSMLTLYPLTLTIIRYYVLIDRHTLCNFAVYSLKCCWREKIELINMNTKRSYMCGK